jgi:hypothetical protein
VTQIPDVELDVFTNTVDAAGSRANRGDVTGGHDELLHGLQRAEATRDDGEAWGEELVGQWQRALERYAETWRIGSPTAAHTPLQWRLTI